jgi:hypothetical protein
VESSIELLIYVANGLYLTSYLVRSMLYLRLLSVTAAICLVGYFASLPEPLVTVISWNLVFVGLNLIHITLLVRRRFLRHSGRLTRRRNQRAQLRKHFGNILGHSDIS